LTGLECKIPQICRFLLFFVSLGVGFPTGVQKNWKQKLPLFLSFVGLRESMWNLHQKVACLLACY
jgi:hypothetical protein